MVGVALDWRMRLIVTSACGSSQSQSWSRKLSATPDRMLRKWALKFWMATSAALRLWLPGWTSSISMLYSSHMSSFRFAEILLSSTCLRGWMLVCLRRYISFLYACIISGSLRLDIGLTSMPLLSMSTMIMMYLLPDRERVGNCPVWSEKMV